jgi:hypothetical protein
LPFHASFCPEAEKSYVFSPCAAIVDQSMAFLSVSVPCSDVSEGKFPCAESSWLQDTNLIVVDRTVLGNTGQCFANKFQPVNDVVNPQLLKKELGAVEPIDCAC